MSYSSTSAAATSSCVESGLDAQRTTSAPPALSVRARFAVSVVTCRHAEIRRPASGCSRSKRSRIAASTGICRSAHWMRRTPSGVSARSFTSYRFVVAMQLLSENGIEARARSGTDASFLRGQKSFVLALLPLERALAPGEPGVDRVAQRRLVTETGRKRDVCELDSEAGAQLAERTKLVQLPHAVHAVAARAARRDDEIRV